ncbi:hypothetical protein [Spiroplasma citri]|uniref:rolling circle replication-associated protein n=1 Tax=Spiroplasma citri TaxID=2133 RepID=UPI0013A09801|nr:hypothetical protein [Spiroplasma citri]QIA67504.1 hypothetical protein GMI18_07625 [Spiroplasma citri]
MLNDKKLKNSCYRSQGNCIRKAIHNFSECNNLTFITLTFKENITDVKKANYQFNLFIKKIKYLYQSDLKYLKVYEYQKRGAIHFQIIFDKYISSKIIRKCWNYGIIKSLSINNKYIDFIKYFVYRYITKPLIKEKTQKVYDLNIKSYQFSYNCKNSKVKVGVNYE